MYAQSQIRQHHQSRRARGLAWLSAGLLVLTLTVVQPQPSDADGPVPSACPEMTDSIRRIFIALFLREPSANEAFHWTSKYMNGETNLPEIAAQLIRSSEFQTRYGARTSSEFVELMYRNTRRPLPSTDELSHWTSTLNTGYGRGPMSLSLIESEEFVASTATSRPLSGYLRWYPPGTHWYCGTGSRTELSIKPLIGEVIFADRLIRNDGDVGDNIQIATVENGVDNAVMATGLLPPRVTDYTWFGAFAGDGFYGSSLNITARASTRWVVVFYTEPIGRSRLGWQIQLNLGGDGQRSG